MSVQTILRTVEFKLYPSAEQAKTLDSWLGACCWVYNRALEQRTKAYKRRGESPTLYDQCKLLTEWRDRMERLRLVPAQFERDALRRVDRGMKSFFRRCKAGEKPGYPRFRSRHRYNSLECLAPGKYLRGNKITVPVLGSIRCRGIGQDVSGVQKLLRIIRRPSGWYAQILFERTVEIPDCVPDAEIGIDMGLNSFAVLSDGEVIENPRFARKSEAKKKRLQRRVSRKQKGSKNRCKAVKRLARHHERVAAQRKDFAHQQSRRLVNRFGLIAHEDLNIKGLAKSKLSKSILDAAWGLFLGYLRSKAECASCRIVAVDPRGTSQECPSCGAIRKKTLSERIHSCPCGMPPIDRDHAAAQVILSRAAGVAAASPAEESTSDRSNPAKPVLRNRKSQKCVEHS